MKIEFINHSSIIFKANKISLICDPWIEGTVFHNGWDLLAPTKFQYSDFEQITHIWISHEHPDHFSTSNIKNINKIFRKKHHCSI